MDAGEAWQRFDSLLGITRNTSSTSWTPAPSGVFDGYSVPFLNAQGLPFAFLNDNFNIADVAENARVFGYRLGVDDPNSNTANERNDLLVGATNTSAPLVFNLKAALDLYADWSDNGDPTVIDGYPLHLNFYGGARGDTASGGTFEDQMFGGGGNDTLDGQEGSDLVDGGRGDDDLSGGEGDDVVLGGFGMDVISGGTGNDHISGGRGGDTIDGDEGDDCIEGGDGNDVIVDLDGDNVVYGNDLDSDGPGDQPDNDFIQTGNGDDFIFGQFGNDNISAGGGADNVDGGTGNDIIRAEAGDDIVLGGSGNDIIRGGLGNDQIDAGSGDDQVFGNDMNATNAANDDDEIDLGAGDDQAQGNGGNDLILGGSGNDLIEGNGGNDVLSGDEGNDELFGDDGNDVLWFGAGHDVGTGGAGADTFAFDDDDGTITLGQNLITDFTQEFLNSDTIDMKCVEGLTHLSVIELGDDQVRLLGFSAEFEFEESPFDYEGDFDDLILDVFVRGDNVGGNGNGILMQDSSYSSGAGPVCLNEGVLVDIGTPDDFDWVQVPAGGDEFVL
ncbi:MAG: calcium-binding protein [Parvularcula sp.]|nr:calcium-binding protein [Parvularcula sp.]